MLIKKCFNILLTSDLLRLTKSKHIYKALPHPSVVLYSVSTISRNRSECCVYSSQLPNNY